MTTEVLARLASPLPAREWAQRVAGSPHTIAAVSIAVVCAMGYLWAMVANYAEEILAHRSAAATALYIDSFVEPLAQGLAGQAELPEKKRSALAELLSPAAMGKPILSFRIWVGDRVVFSNHDDLIGRSFPRTRAREFASRGHLVAKFELEGEDDVQERDLDVPILEIYAPIRQSGTGKVIAIAETYDLAITLKNEILTAQFASLLIVGTATFGFLAAFMGLTGRMRGRISELVRQHLEGSHFQKKVCQANGRVLATNERQLRQVGVTLTGGPSRSIALALQKLDALSDTIPAEERAGRVDLIRRDLKKALYEIRSVSAHLTSLEIEGLSLTDTIKRAALLQQRRAGISVGCELQNLHQNTPYAVKACVFRFLERTLDSEFRCLQGRSVLVRAAEGKQKLEIRIVSETPGAAVPVERMENYRERSERLRDQIEGLGGSLIIDVEPHRQCSIGITFDIRDTELDIGE